MELLQQEAVELPLAFGLLVVQQRALLTGLPAHSGQREEASLHQVREGDVTGFQGTQDIILSL